MKRKILLVGLGLGLLAGCRLQASAQLTETAQVTQISGAQTLEASLSQTPEITPTSQPTWTPSPTYTPVQETSVTSMPTLRPTATQGSVVSGCDDARFVADVTIPDGTEFDPGERFTKTWRLENNGTCAWTTDYSVSFLSGDPLSGEVVDISEQVQPGETYDLSIDMKAPFEAGTYTGTWTIKNENGISFGETFFVQIEVTSSATATFTPSATSPPSETPTPSSTPGETPSPTSGSTPTPSQTDEPAPTPDPSATGEGDG